MRAHADCADVPEPHWQVFKRSLEANGSAGLYFPDGSSVTTHRGWVRFASGNNLVVQCLGGACALDAQSRSVSSESVEPSLSSSSSSGIRKQAVTLAATKS